MRADWIVATADWPPALGGMSEYARGLVDGLKARGESVHVRVAPGRGSPQLRAARLLPQLVEDRARTRAPRLLALAWSPVGVAAWALRRSMGLRYEVVTYGLDVLEPLRSPKTRSWALRVLGGADRVWSISRYTRDCVAAMGIDERKLGLLPPGVNWQRFGAASIERCRALRDEFRLDGKRIVLSVGRLVRRKGHDLVLRALRDLPDDVVYWVVGDGPEREALEDLARELDVADRVRFAGALAADDVDAAYGVSQVFALPTREMPESGDVEGFGIVYLEANAAGLPVVATACGGCGDAVVDGESGLLIPTEDPAGLASALRRLLDDPELARALAAHGLRRAQQEFDWSRVVSPLLKRRTTTASLHTALPPLHGDRI